MRGQWGALTKETDFLVCSAFVMEAVSGQMLVLALLRLRAVGETYSLGACAPCLGKKYGFGLHPELYNTEIDAEGERRDCHKA